MRRPTPLACLACLALLAALAGCRYDPVKQSVIDALGPDTEPPSATHRPGQPCLACHTAYAGATPAFAVAGTVYTLDSKQALVPAPNVLVSFVDSLTNHKYACTNTAGNFAIDADDWTDLTFPLSPVAAGVPMVSLIGRDGSCATCHVLPAQNPDALNATTGAGHASAGAIIVGSGSADPSCLPMDGGAP
jgi:hypothetical protein